MNFRDAVVTAFRENGMFSYATFGDDARLAKATERAYALVTDEHRARISFESFAGEVMKLRDDFLGKMLVEETIKAGRKQ